AGGGDHALLLFRGDGGELSPGLAQSLDLTDGIRIVHEDRPARGFAGQHSVALASDGAGFLALFRERSAVHPDGNGDTTSPYGYTLAAAIDTDGVPRTEVKVVTTVSEELGSKALAGVSPGVYLESSYLSGLVGQRLLSSDG